ncbi:MAG: cache domain-containing protein, partial [Deltaproteobacteria bacterium]
MRQFKSSSIRNNIILLIIIMTLVPFGFMACSLVLERKHQRNEAMRESSIYAGQIAKLVSQIAENTELLLNMLSRLPMVQTGDEKAVNSFLLDLVNQYPQYSSIFIVDKSGKRWATTNQMSGSVSYSERRYFANAVSSGQFSSGEYAVGKVKKRPVFSFGLPVINSSGAISGVAVATIELSGLRDLLLKHISKDHMSLVLMDHKGKILIHSTRPDLEGTQEQNAVFGRMLQGSREAVIESEEEQGGSTKLLTYKKLFLSAETEPYIYVALHAEKSFLLKEPNRKFGLNLVVLMTAALSSFVIVYRTSKRFLLDKVDESEHRHRILFETSPQGIIYQNADGAVISSNPSSEKLFGKLLVDKDAGKAPAENPLYIHEDGAPYPLETHPNMEALSTGKAVSGSIMGIFNSSDGTYTWLRINSIPISRADEKKPYMVYSMYEDITRQMKQEQERLEIERQLLHTQKLESLGIMAGGIAHDFNNLLQSILGNIELASMKLAPDSSAKNLISNAMISGKQAAQLTNLMLAYVGKGFIDKKKLDLNLLIRENARIFRSAATTSVSTELSLSAELPAIIAD